MSGTYEQASKLVAEGKSLDEISYLLGVSRISVYTALKREPGRRNKTVRSDAGSGSRKYISRPCECGEAFINASSSKCYRCEQKRRTANQVLLLRDRANLLVEFAQREGFIPSCREAGKVLGVGRDRANLALREAFGPETRTGSTKIRRPFPVA